ncbi:hypothetical protein BT67DRAFT_195365 [Trichocladium antarcticum]|uniref:DNA/RNA-binding domain-containing protein n=1 Tax=Trichocladium antarcticum TaxID=1450529 RepID=A0AAN6ZGF0_9PEZI|nr:hypothetical protein BT67DRAFT_195365 [Trichocladium antarcticum]
MDLAKKWNQHLRRESRKTRLAVSCPLCRLEITNQNGSNPEVTLGVFEGHFQESHARLLDERPSEEENALWLRSLWETAQSQDDNRDGYAKPGIADASPRPPKPPQPRPSARDRKPRVGPGSPKTTEDRRPSRSPTPSRTREEGSRPRSLSSPKRAQPRPVSGPVKDDVRADFDRGSYQKGKLWSPDDDGTAPRPRPYEMSNVASQQRPRASPASLPRPHRQPIRPPAPAEDESTAAEIIRQPETRPISQEQLIAEVKGIYAGVVMVESKCIEVDNTQTSQASQHNPANKLNNEQWQALIALHRTLLHEHHDFFLASQHPSASPALRRLAAKYAMPARMWRHGIHSFLELLRHRLPASLDHMLTFIYLAYSMMALLYETVPAFEETWIECLGDLGRYRMAIEDDDIRDREVWTAVSRHWYSKASDKVPAIGRLYHHLAILARPNALQQLYYYSKSLCVAMSFTATRESIMTLFEPILAPPPNLQQARLPPAEYAFVKSHAILFSGRQYETLEPTMDEFFQLLDNHIGRSTRRWLESGYFISIANICALMGYASETNPIVRALKDTHPSESPAQDRPMHEPASKDLADALRLFNGTVNVVCRRFGDPNVLPFLHVTLVFLHHLTFYQDAMAHVAPSFPWKLAALMLNTLVGSCDADMRARLENDDGEHFSQNVQNQTAQDQTDEPEVTATPGFVSTPRPLPDDYALRGLIWAEQYFPAGWFINDKIDDDEKYFEVPSMMEERKERVLWLGVRIAERGEGRWLTYDKGQHLFGVNPEFEVELKYNAPATPPAETEYGELPDAATAAF